jgi:hypothetical protein
MQKLVYTRQPAELYGTVVTLNFRKTHFMFFSVPLCLRGEILSLLHDAASCRIHLMPLRPFAFEPR